VHLLRVSIYICVYTCLYTSTDRCEAYSSHLARCPWVYVYVHVCIQLTSTTVYQYVYTYMYVHVRIQLTSTTLYYEEVSRRAHSTHICIYAHIYTSPVASRCPSPKQILHRGSPYPFSNFASGMTVFWNIQHWNGAGIAREAAVRERYPAPAI